MQSEVEHHSELGSFRIVSLNGTYYAVPKSRWPVRPADLLDGSNRTILSNPSLTDLVDTVSRHKVALFSIIIPTRARPTMLRRALDSLKSTAYDLDSVEVILVVDSDDTTMSNFSYSGLHLRQVVVAPGKTMGELNMAGYDVASGDYIFLLNDDVIARTPGWDLMIADSVRKFPDGVAMVHVNDKLFHETLCTFPLLSRSLCEMMGGICRREYIRYRIDDHIHNIFNLLALLGHRRIVYMEEVVFEHLNRFTGADGTISYVPNPAIHSRDTLFFDGQLPARKSLAVRLAEHIDAFARQNVAVIRANKLLAVTDSVAIRDPRHSRRSQGATTLSSDNTRVTVGVVSADIRSEHSRLCLEHLKQNTRNFDLLVVDNNRGPNFNHAREMNRMLEFANTEFVVLMDDDVFVEAGWLDELLKTVNPNVGMVTPAHKNLAGDFVYGGIVMRPDQSGHHTHIFSQSRQPRRVQTMCSAVYLLDLAKCGHLRVDEQYSKYFLDIEFGLKVWEAGFQVVCATSTVVTHVGGGTLKQGSELSGILYEEQRRKFVSAWTETGRYWKLESAIWRHIPELRPLVEHPGLVGRILEAAHCEEHAVFNSRVQSYCDTFGAYPALLQFAENAAYENLTEGKSRSAHSQENLRCFIAASQERRAKNPDVSSSRGADAIGNAPWQPPMEEGLLPSAGAPRVADNTSGKSGNGTGFFREEAPDTSLKNHRGYVISRFEHKYFAIPEGEGEFSYDQFKRGG
ncbi:MAG TPA: glycosyltransferase, partial [Terriglobia bacterium]|nr:glycosyltransferase [Terriglobia bacterium]